MKKRALSFAAAVMSAMAAVSSLTASAARDTTPSYYINKQYVAAQNASPVDEALFERYLKYSFLIDDANNVSQDVLDLCRFVVETERAQLPNVYCMAARNEIRTGEKAHRLSLDDPGLAARFADPFPLYYSELGEIEAVYPDIVYEDSLNEVYKKEYWLDDEGSERLIYTEFNDNTLEYIRFYDAMPDEPEIAAKTVASEDGSTFIYYDTIEIAGATRTDTPEYAGSDVWEYEILSDGTAVLINNKLPKDADAEPIEETLTLPTELDGHKVCGVYFQALSFTGVTKLVIPETYTYIFGLQNLMHLKELEINAPELELDNNSFYYCPELEKVTLNVKAVKGTPFCECDKLETLDILGAETICAGAFRSLKALKNVTLPETLKYIGQDAFADTAVRELVVPENIKGVGVYDIPYSRGSYVSDPFTSDNVGIADKECVIKSFYSSEGHRFAMVNKCKFTAINDIMYGDTNKDGSISVADAVVLQKHLLGNGTVGYEADVNRDGSINTYDMVSMRKKVIG